MEGSQAQVEELRNSLTTAETLATAAQTDLLAARQELERALPFEREVKEKNLLIGKLRHEAVILNDHLTKALRFLKKGRPEDTVDRCLVSIILRRVMLVTDTGTDNWSRITSCISSH